MFKTLVDELQRVTETLGLPTFMKFSITNRRFIATVKTLAVCI